MGPISSIRTSVNAIVGGAAKGIAAARRSSVTELRVNSAFKETDVGRSLFESSSSLQQRRFSSPSIETATQRLGRHFADDRNINDRCKQMRDFYISDNKNKINNKENEEGDGTVKVEHHDEPKQMSESLGDSKNLKESTINALEVLTKTIENPSTFSEGIAQSPLLNKEKNKWVNFPIKDIESIPGIGIRYSSTAIERIAKSLLPQLIRSAFPDSTPSLIEIGGFGFSDAFLLINSLAKEKIHLNEYIGIDIHKAGMVAANSFNQNVAQLDEFKTIFADASEGLKLLSPLRQTKDKILIAVRLLSVLQPHEVNSFLQEVSQLLNENDFFIFNFTVYDDHLKKVIQERKLNIQPEDGAYVYKRGGVLEQAFYEKAFIEKLLNSHNLQVIKEVSQVNMPIQGNDDVRGQGDPYNRLIMTVAKTAVSKNMIKV